MKSRKLENFYTINIVLSDEQYYLLKDISQTLCFKATNENKTQQDILLFFKDKNIIERIADVDVPTSIYTKDCDFYKITELGISVFLTNKHRFNSSSYNKLIQLIKGFDDTKINKIINYIESEDMNVNLETTKK